MVIFTNLHSIPSLDTVVLLTAVHILPIWKKKNWFILHFGPFFSHTSAVPVKQRNR